MSDPKRFYETASGEGRRSAPAVQRNRDPITDVLRSWLPNSGLVLEVASGTGEHVVHFARTFPSLEWQPSDVHPAALASIEAWRAGSYLANVRPPLLLDAADAAWPLAAADALLSINMVHISPWASALGLIAGGARILPAGAPLILYGPWRRSGVEPAGSNLAFDADLKRRDPEWGLREVEEFAEAAAPWFRLAATREMPANNLMLLLHRTAASR